MKKIKSIIPALAVLAVILAVFSPCLSHDFINLDDDLYVTDNPVIRGITPANLKNISTAFFITHYQPLTILSYLIEYRFFKLDPFYYHLDNLILHLLNCLLVFWIIYRVNGNILPAFLTALFFGLHPLQVESVAWVSERKNLLYAFFFLSAMVSYLYYLGKEKKRFYYWVCLFFFILSLLSKSMAVTLPLVLLLLDYFSGRKITRQACFEKIPYFLLALAGGLVALWAAHLTGAPYEPGRYSVLARLMGASSDVVFYLQKIILPLGLSASYPYFEAQNHPLRYFLSFVGLGLMFVVLFRSLRYSKKIIFGCGFFLLTVLPALRFLPLESIAAADRYVYVSSIGIFYLLAAGLYWAWGKKSTRTALLKAGLILFTAGLVVFWSWLSWQRCGAWKNSLNLWNDVLKKYPANASAYNNRGVYFLRDGQFEKSHADFLMAVKIKTEHPADPTFKYNPTHKYYYLNLARSLEALGRRREAREIFQQLIREAQVHSRLYPPASGEKINSYNRKEIAIQAYFALADLEDAEGNQAQAIAGYKKVLEIDSGLPYVYDRLGSLYLRMGKRGEAKSEFIRAIRTDPAYLPAYIVLAEIYQSLGQNAELEQLYKQAVTFQLDFFAAYNYLGNLYSDLGMSKKAISLYLRAIRIDPSSEEACLGLGNAYLTTGRTPDAIGWFKEALALDPKLAVAHNNLALAYYYAGQNDLASKHSEQASRLGYPLSPKLTQLLGHHKK